MDTLLINRPELDAIRHQRGLTTDKSLAAEMGLSSASVSRVLAGKSAPGHRFIAAALKTFPVRFEDLFIVAESPSAAQHHSPAAA